MCRLAGRARAEPGLGPWGPNPSWQAEDSPGREEAGTWTAGLQAPSPRNPLRARLGGPAKETRPALPGPQSAGREAGRLCAQTTAICSAHICKAPTMCWLSSLLGRAHQGPASSGFLCHQRKALPWFRRHARLLCASTGPLCLAGLQGTASMHLLGRKSAWVPHCPGWGGSCLLTHRSV